MLRFIDDETLEQVRRKLAYLAPDATEFDPWIKERKRVRFALKSGASVEFTQEAGTRLVDFDLTTPDGSLFQAHNNAWPELENALLRALAFDRSHWNPK
jgi:hypothetical protein